MPKFAQMIPVGKFSESGVKMQVKKICLVLTALLYIRGACIRNDEKRFIRVSTESRI